MARPSEYRSEIGIAICAGLAEGKSVREICADESMPCARTVYYWLESHPEFLQQYTRARDEQADLYAEQIVEIADDARNDWMERNHGEDDPGWVANGEHIQRSRLRVEARKWIAAKLKPKKYGDSVDVNANHTGGVSVTIKGM